MADRGLTIQMQHALAHYAQHGNKSEAYRHAYDCSRMDPDSVKSRAWEVFSHPLMAQAVATIRATAVERAKIDAQWVLERAARLADFNLQKFIKLNDDGMPYYDFREATAEDWYCIDELSIDHVTKGSGNYSYEVERVKVKTAQKRAALELVGKHVDVQAFKDRVEVLGSIGVVHMSVDQYKVARRAMLEEDDC